MKFPWVKRDDSVYMYYIREGYDEYLRRYNARIMTPAGTFVGVGETPHEAKDELYSYVSRVLTAGLNAERHKRERAEHK